MELEDKFGREFGRKLRPEALKLPTDHEVAVVQACHDRQRGLPTRLEELDEAMARQSRDYLGLLEVRKSGGIGRQGRSKGGEAVLEHLHQAF